MKIISFAMLLMATNVFSSFVLIKKDSIKVNFLAVAINSTAFNNILQGAKTYNFIILLYFNCSKYFFPANLYLLRDR